ncbi:MAG: hypothetical protein HY902_05315 [Deltaproteobacteria bacterium]|nr:hypothetical protein [Deltaproteobacteria bacterium]
MGKIVRTLAVVALASLVGGNAAAAERASKIKGGSGKISVNDADRAGIEDLGVANIEGRIYKPSVFFVLVRGDVAYQGIDFKQNFTDRIVKGALKRPF